MTSMGISVLLFSFFVDLTSLLIIVVLAFMLGGINDWLDFAVFRMFEHRNWFTHSLSSPLFIIGIFFSILSAFFSWRWTLVISIIFSLSWLVHVLLDSLTPTGVYIFSPKRIVNGKIYYKNLKWNVIIIGISIFVAIMAFVINQTWF
jgi:membrane-bound metal-dependent hydrolase YbcI (DUF457 family)